MTRFPLSINLNGCELLINRSFTYLGIVTDEQLKFNFLASYICKNISGSIDIINKIKNFVPYFTLKSIYYALVSPYLNYYNLVWAGAFPTHLHPLLILKKKALRAMNNKPFYFHTNDLFLDGFLLKLNDIYKFRLCSYMYNNGSLLEYDRAHNYATRNRELLLPSFQRL